MVDRGHRPGVSAFVTPRDFTPSAEQLAMMRHVTDVPRAGVWAAMGTGKTAASLVHLDALQMAGIETKPALVLAPLRVAQSTWPDEAAKWAQTSHLEIVPIVGDAQARSTALVNARAGRAPIYTMNYDNLPWLMERLAGGSWPFGMVIADESTRLKGLRLGGSASRRARALAAVAHKHCTHWVNLTGTPAPNGLLDLWGQTWFLDAGVRLGRTYGAFEKRWFGYDRASKESGGKPKAFPHSQAEIEEKLRDLHITIKASGVAEPIVRPVTVRLPTKARAHYREMERLYFTMIRDGVDVEAPNAGVAMMKCLQIASGAIYHGDEGQWQEIHDAKLQALESIIEEASGTPVLVAYQFKHSLSRLLKAFPKGRHLDANPATIRQWNAGEIPTLFAHPASAGHGLNLQDGGNILAVFDDTWNLEHYQQIVERIGPMRQKQAGHDRAVYIYPIVAEDTFDEDLVLRRVEKIEVQDSVLAAMRRRG